MASRQDLCKKIQEIYPNAGVCGVDYDVSYDEELKAWAVDLHRGSHHLKTFIENEEADSCLKGKMCIPLGLQVAQLKRNFDIPSCS